MRLPIKLGTHDARSQSVSASVSYLAAGSSICIHFCRAPGSRNLATQIQVALESATTSRVDGAIRRGGVLQINTYELILWGM